LADADRRGTVAAQDVVSDPQAEAYRVFRVGDAEHERVTDRLDLRAAEAR